MRHGHQTQDQPKLVDRCEAAKILRIGDAPDSPQDSPVHSALRQEPYGILSRNANANSVVGKRKTDSKDLLDQIQTVDLFQLCGVVHQAVVVVVVVVVVAAHCNERKNAQ